MGAEPLKAQDFRGVLPRSVLDVIMRYEETGELLWQEPPDLPPAEPEPCETCHGLGWLARRAPGTVTMELVECQVCGVVFRWRRERWLALIPEDFQGRSFADFYAANERAARICELAQEWVTEGTCGLFLNGPVGSYKTTLGCAAFAAAVTPGTVRTAAWWTVPDLLEEIRRSYDHDLKLPGTSRAIEYAKSCELLFLDDIGAEHVTTWVRDQLFQVINTRSNRHRRTIITSNLSTEELAKHVGEPIASRVVGMSAPYVLRLDQGADLRLRRLQVPR